MNLREQAALDARAIVEDSADGFGWPLTVTSPAAVSAELVGFSADIGLTIDPETGQAVAGRRASVALSIAALTEAGLAIPRGVADSSGTPWVVRFEDLQGSAQSFKVTSTMIDRTIGLVTCVLEAYRLQP